MLKATQVNILGRKISVSFPNVGQFMDIESTKMALTTRFYSSFASSNSSDHAMVVDMVDAFSTFQTMVPDFKKQIGVESLLDMSIAEFYPIVKAYKEEYLPFYTETLNGIKELSKTKGPDAQNA